MVVEVRTKRGSASEWRGCGGGQDGVSGDGSGIGIGWSRMEEEGLLLIEFY